MCLRYLACVACCPRASGNLYVRNQLGSRYSRVIELGSRNRAKQTSKRPKTVYFALPGCASGAFRAFNRILVLKAVDAINEENVFTKFIELCLGRTAIKSCLDPDCAMCSMQNRFGGSADPE